MSAYNFIDMSGMQFPHLTVIRRAVGDEVPRSYARQAFWVCRCEYGTEFITRGDSIRYGLVKSCGCLRQEVMRRNQLKRWEGGKQNETAHI